MDTKLLREFIAFAECLNFTVAAKNLYISQPTLSRHLAELEKELEAELVIRGQAPGLTYAGETLLAEAGRLLHCESELRASVLAATKKQSGRLRIEYYPYMRSVMQKMNKALNRMQFEYENIHFDIDFIQPRKQASITDSVLQGYFDVAVLARTTFGPAAIEEKRGICCLPLPTLRSRICFFVANDSPLARYDEISVSELDGMEILFGMNQEFQNFQEDMRKLFSDVGICPIEVPCRINDIAEFAYSRMGERVHILTEDDLTIESSPYLTNSQCKVLRCKEDIGATPYLLYRAESDNIALDSFLSSMQQVIDAE